MSLLQKTLVLSAATCILAACVNMARVDDVSWRTDYRQARMESRRTGRPLVLQIGGHYCVWCQRLENTTLRNPQVGRLLETHFVPMKLDGNANPWFTQAVNVQVYPTIIIAAPNGSILFRKDGYMDAASLRAQLQRVLAVVRPPSVTREANWRK